MTMNIADATVIQPDPKPMMPFRGQTEDGTVIHFDIDVGV
jgi:hypothetical protein